MSLARVVVTAVRVEGRSKSAVAREYKVSRRWVHELVHRFDAEGEAGLVPRSRRPHHCPARTSVEVEEAIVGWRKRLSEQGLDAGAATIAVHLADQLGTPVPSTATIWRVLSRRGMVVPQPHKRPRSSYIRFQAELPNQRWQADITHWQLADGSGVEIVDVIDDHSRYAIAATARTVFKAADVVATFLTAADRHGLPEGLLTDNGAVFTAAPRGGRCALETELATLGVRYTHSRPYHPQTCGKVERFHQTLKRWLARQDPAATPAQLQTQLDTFVDYYNQIRPHRAVGRKPPALAYTARPKAVPIPPAPAPTTPAAQHRVRVDRVDATGVVTLRHNSRLHHIGIGRGHAGTRVTLLVADLHIRIITDDGQLLRELTLDPTRDYQPQQPR